MTRAFEVTNQGNLMKFFVAKEEGASALLASLLDPSLANLGHCYRKQVKWNPLHSSVT